MKTKRQFTNRILSLVLAVVMVLAMLPAMNMTAYAATEVESLGKNTHTPYTDGLTHYFTYDNYLYRATFTNLKATGRTVSIGNYSGQLYLSLLREGGGSSPDLLKDKFDNSTKVTTSDLPKEVGGSISGYLYYIPAAISVSPANQWADEVEEPVVNIVCASATGPTWSWASDYSSAKAVFTVSKDDVCVTLNADISAETEECAKESQITYTASVRFNGVQYTNTQTATGILDHDWGAMEGKPCYEICSRCDALRVVEHSVEGDRCTVCGDTIYSVLVAGKPISSRNASDVLGDGTVSYDASTSTLTLSETTVDASEMNVPALEIIDGTITLALVGDNALISCRNVQEDIETGEWYGYPAISIAEGASVIISGDEEATLKLEGNDFGYTAHDHIPSAAALSGGSLTVNGGSITTENSGGIRLSGDYTQTSGAVRVSYLEAQNVSVSDGILESHGWSGINPSYMYSNAGGIHGIFAQKSIAISGGTVTTSSGVLGHDGNYIGAHAVTGEEVVTHGLYALESIAISGGTVTSTGGHGGYVIGELGDLILGGYMEGDEVVGTPAGASLEAPQWSISDTATFICGSDSSHRSRTQACNDELCMFCGKQYEKAHSYDKTTHICSLCGKVETFKVHWIGPETPGLENGITTFGQDFVQIIPVPENTHVKIGEVYARDEFWSSVNYTYENGVLSIAAKDIPAADISIVFNQFVDVTCHANGGKIVPDEGYPGSYDTGFAADGSYWIQEWCVGEPIYPLKNGSVIREGYTFVEWQDASGKVYPANWTAGAMERATVDVTLYAQWKCNHTIGDVELRDNGDGTHSDYCGECGEPFGNRVNQPHDFGDNTHKCVCGKKITPEVTAPTAKENLIYDGTSKELINPGSTTGGTMQYSLDNASWSTEIPAAITVGTHVVYYKVIGDENYEDVAARSITVNIADKTAPTGEIKVKDNSWTSFWNNLTFGLFFKETQDVTITANDVGSGVSAIQYYLADGEKEPDELKAVSDWVDYNGTFQINPNNKYIVYAKVSDNAGNITYINSAGIVIYTDSTLDTTVKDEITYVLTKNAEQAFTLNLNGNTVAYVKIGTTVLGSDDYEVLGNIVFISDELLENLAVGEYTVTVGINPMGATFVAGDAPAEVVIPLVVEKAVVDINISDFGKVYDGTPVSAEYKIRKSSDSSPAASNISYNEKVEYKAWYEDDSAYSETAPVNAGDYNVRITVEETDKTTSATATADFTIEQKPVTVTATAPDKIYDGTVNIDTSAIEFTVSGLVGSETVGFTVKEAWYNGPNVGEDKEVSVVYKVTGDTADNYAFPAGGEYMPPNYFIAARADIIAKDISNAFIILGDVLTYNGAEQTQAVKKVVTPDDLEATYDVSGNTAKNVGVYILTVKGNGNFTGETMIFYEIAPDTSGIESLSEDNVTSADKDDIEAVKSQIENAVTDLADDESKEKYKEIADKCDELLDKLEKVAEATDTENTEKVKDVTVENVTPEDKADLEKAKADLEKALKDNGGNYTEDEKKAIEDDIKRIDDALEVIGNVEEVEETISKLPAVDTVKPDDEETIKAITDAQTAYNVLSDYEKSLVDEAAKANLDKLVAALVAYDIVEGDGSSWTEDSDHNITFVVNGLFSKFVGIKVDGKDVDKANYEVKAGSTIITLKASYLDTLAVGEHTITVVYTDGSTDGTFNVHAKAISPATGDNRNMFLWIALLFISGGAVITLTVVDRKKRMASNR